MPLTLSLPFQIVVDRFHDFRIPAFFRPQKVVLNKPETDGTPRPKRSMISQVAFGRWKPARPPFADHVLMHKLATATDSPCDFRHCHKIAFVNSQNLRADSSISNSVDR